MKRRLGMVLFATIIGLFSRSLHAQTLTYQGGYLIAHPKIVVSYWNWPGSDPAGVKNSVDGMMAGIGGSKYIGPISQYSTLSHPINNDLANISPAKWSDPTPWPTDTAGDRHPSQADVSAAVQRAETHFGGWAQDTIIFIVTGPNRTFYGGGGCAYHSWRPNGTTGHATIFAELPYQADTQVPPRWNGVCPPQGGTTTGEFEALREV